MYIYIHTSLLKSEWWPWWHGILHSRYSPFITLNIYYHSLQNCRVSAEMSPGSLVEMSLNIAYCFPFANFNILSLFLIVPILFTVCLGVVLFGLAIFGILCSFELDACFLYQFRKVFCYHVFKSVLCLFHSLFFY